MVDFDVVGENQKNDVNVVYKVLQDYYKIYDYINREDFFDIIEILDILEVHCLINKDKVDGKNDEGSVKEIIDFVYEDKIEGKVDKINFNQNNVEDSNKKIENNSIDRVNDNFIYKISKGSGL